MPTGTLIVTQSQKQEGFYVQGFRGAVYSLPFEVIKQLPDGNWLVKEPSATHPSYHAVVPVRSETP